MISIIIPTYNEKKSLGECVESLRKQSVPDFEIIVIDDGSTDGTLEILKKFKKTLPNFKFAKQNHKGAGAARNLGEKFARGKILVFVDADMTFDKNFLKKLTAPIEANPTSPRLRGARGTFSKEEYVANWDNIWARCWNINEGWEPKRRHSKNYPDHQAVFRAVLRTEFEKVGGFTPGGYDDDWSLYKKLGYEAVNANGAIFYHKNPENLVEIFNHAKWVGKRKYKFGYLGFLGGLVRSSFPVSLVVGIYKVIRYSPPVGRQDFFAFPVFKIVYDFGIFVGILEYLFTKKGAK